MLALLKNHLNYLKGNIFECVLRSMINFFFCFNFFHNIKRVDSFSSSNYIEYKSNSDRNKTLSVEDISIKCHI